MSFSLTYATLNRFKIKIDKCNINMQSANLECNTNNRDVGAFFRNINLIFFRRMYLKAKITWVQDNNYEKK